MPIDTETAESNRRQTARLRRLIANLKDEHFAIRLHNGWTIAMAIAHIAFWDRQRLCLIKRWAAGDWCQGDYDGELFNEVLSPFLELIPSHSAAELALEAAEQIDQLLLDVPDALIDAAMIRPDRPNLDRGSHRAHHLDQIELAIRDAGHELDLG